MSTSNLFIPRKIKVGFQNRPDTYTGRLAYVIYYDNKEKLRKEASWQSWRSKDVEPEDYDNTPMEGFVLNKKVGGYSNGWGDFRQAYVRVYDPRGFEFEITVPNLLFILEHSSSIKGKGLEGEFVYAWDGTELILLPASSPDYAELTKLNDQRFKNETVKAKDLQIGATYLHNSNVEWVYMGRFDYYDTGYRCADGKWFDTYRKATNHCAEHSLYRNRKSAWGWSPYKEYDCDREEGCVGKRHYFYDRAAQAFCLPKSLSGLLIDTITTAPAADYAELFEKMECTDDYSPYDESKDEKISYELEQAKQRVDSAYRGATFKSQSGQIVDVSKARAPGDWQTVIGYTCRFRDDACDQQMAKLFEWKAQPGSSCKTMTPVPFEDIFNKFQFYYTKQYLANGKYYRTVW